MVIAIISILAALLLPALSRARRAARAVSCLSNAKQTQLGVILYGGDFAGAIPVWASELTIQRYTRALYYHGYIPDMAAMQCPIADIIENPTDFWDCSGFGLNGMSGMAEQYKTVAPGGTALFVNFENIPRASSAITLGDSIGWYGTDAYGAVLKQWGPVGKDGNEDPYTYFHIRHDGRANMAYADGHAAAMAPADIARDVALVLNGGTDEVWVCLITSAGMSGAGFYP